MLTAVKLLWMGRGHFPQYYLNLVVYMHAFTPGNISIAIVQVHYIQVEKDLKYVDKKCA